MGVHTRHGLLVLPKESVVCCCIASDKRYMQNSRIVHCFWLACHAWLHAFLRRRSPSLMMRQSRALWRRTTVGLILVLVRFILPCSSNWTVTAPHQAITAGGNFSGLIVSKIDVHNAPVSGAEFWSRYRQAASTPCMPTQVGCNTTEPQRTLAASPALKLLFILQVFEQEGSTCRRAV